MLPAQMPPEAPPDESEWNECPTVCREWFGNGPIRCSQSGMRGLSGVAVYRVWRPASREQFVVKSFGPRTVAHAVWVHRLMRHLRNDGIDQVPEVMPVGCCGLVPGAAAVAGNTLATAGDGSLWELLQFMPGKATARPTIEQAKLALQTLARIHLVAAQMPGEPPRRGMSPGHLQRIEQAEQMLRVPWHVRQRSIPMRGIDSTLASLWDRAETIFAAADGTGALEHTVRLRPSQLLLQAVLRDIWSDHCLFSQVGGDGSAADQPANQMQLTGMIDFHAAGIDTPASDLSRLLGSWQPQAPTTQASFLEVWREPLDAYQAVRPFQPLERSMVAFLHATAVIFSLDNWFRWTLEERRTFPDIQRVYARMNRLLEQLPIAIEYVNENDSAGNER